MSLRDRLSSHTALKLLALACAVLVWINITNRPLSEAMFEARLYHVNVPEDLEMSPGQAERVAVILRGTESALSKVREQNVLVEADFSEVYGAGKKTFNVSELTLGLPRDVALVRAVPSQLSFTFEERVRREVIVEPQFVGSYEQDYEISSIQVEPASLEIVGPQGRVALIDAIITDPIDLSEVVGGRSFRVTAYLSDPYVRFEQDPTVTVDVQMRKR